MNAYRSEWSSKTIFKRQIDALNFFISALHGFKNAPKREECDAINAPINSKLH
jgi:hypothetical protein